LFNAVTEYDGAKDVHTLIKHGANVNVKDKKGVTPLHLAENMDVVRLLVKHGADVNATDDGGQTPLHNCKKKDIAQLLIKHGANVYAKNKVGETPLDSFKKYFAKGGDKRIEDKNEEIKYLRYMNSVYSNNFKMVFLHLFFLRLVLSAEPHMYPYRTLKIIRRILHI